jgi:eukaryotic-like serine/threonine-protein kinase
MDEGMLFGVLAVQLGMATPAEVIAAASAHVADRKRSIADRLHSDGVLDDKQRELLASLTADALRVHGGDARKTLQSLGGERAVLRSFGGSLVVDQRGNVSVNPATSSSTDSLDQRGAVSPEHAGRYSYANGDPNAAELGRGGIGRVLIAHDEHIGRDVAIKELLGGGGPAASAPSNAISKTTAMAARFLREARVTGQLEHPNIVPVYEVGQRADGTYYYAMRLVRGRTLGQALGSCGTLQERLKLLPQYVSLCNAVGFAHSRGVIHRDIKPDNVMLGAFGETVVLDWGLAKVRGKKDIRGREIEGELKLLQDAATGQTMDGSAIGTPAYMSPEQADGQVDEIDERSDVWSLGAVLYELLVGRPPFEGVTPFEIIGKVMKEAVQSPRAVDERVPAELSAVALKALTRDPSQRYSTARELAEEIEAFMSGGRIGAYEYSTWELVQSFVRRNRAATVAALVVLLIMLSSGAALAVAYRSAARERDRAEQNEREARARETEANMNLAATFEEKALHLLEDRRYGSARILAAASMMHNPAAKGPHHDEEFASRHPLCAEVLTSAASIVYQADLSILARPHATFELSFRRLQALRDSTIVAGLTPEGELAFVDTANGATVASHAAIQGKFVAFDLAGDSAQLAAVTSNGGIQLFDPQTRKKTFFLSGPPRTPRSIRFSRDASLMLVTDNSGSADLWNVATRKLARTFRDGEKRLRDAMFTADGHTFTTVAGDGYLRLWDVASGTLKIAREGHPSVIIAMDVSPDETQLATAGFDGVVRIWDAADLRPITSIAVHKPQLNFVRFTPDGRLLLAGGDERTVSAFDTATWNRVATIDGLQSSVSSVSVSTDGKTLATAEHGRLRMWDFAFPSKVRSLRSRPFHMYRIAVSPDGAAIAGGYARKPVVDVWDAKTSALLVSLPASGAIFDVAFSRDGKRLFGTSAEARTLEVWETATGQHEVLPMSQSARGVVVSTDGMYVGRGGYDRVQINDATSNALIVELEGTGSVAFAPDGKSVATTRGNEILLFALPSGERLGKIGPLPDRGSDLRFSHDGRWLAVAGVEAHLLVVDVQARKLAFELAGHALWINTVRFSPDDSLLASASDDGTARVWSMASRSGALVFHTFNPTTGVDFMPDGGSIVFGDESTVKVFPIDLSYREADPKTLFVRAQDEVGLELRGTGLVPQRVGH